MRPFCATLGTLRVPVRLDTLLRPSERICLQLLLMQQRPPVWLGREEGLRILREWLGAEAKGARHGRMRSQAEELIAILLRRGRVPGPLDTLLHPSGSMARCLRLGHKRKEVEVVQPEIKQLPLLLSALRHPSAIVPRPI